MKKIINWEQVFNASEKFHADKSVKWAFIENFFHPEFYEKLYETYPKFDDSWKIEDSYDKLAYRKFWGDVDGDKNITQDQDSRYSEPWNELVKYLHTNECIKNFQKFSNVHVTKLKKFGFNLIKKNGFQLPHIHNVGPTTLILMIYFSKNWKEGEPGGTYITPEEDESKMIFEPYNLDNTAIIFHDGPSAGHGVRRVTKDVERRGIQIYLEEFSSDSKWSGDKQPQELIEL